MTTPRREDPGKRILDDSNSRTNIQKHQRHQRQGFGSRFRSPSTVVCPQDDSGPFIGTAPSKRTLIVGNCCFFLPSRDVSHFVRDFSRTTVLFLFSLVLLPLVGVPILQFTMLGAGRCNHHRFSNRDFRHWKSRSSYILRPSINMKR